MTNTENKSHELLETALKECEKKRTKQLLERKYGFQQEEHSTTLNRKWIYQNLCCLHMQELKFRKASLED